MSTTEDSSNYNYLEKMTTTQLLISINKEDKSVPHSVEKELKKIEKLVDKTFNKLKEGGRLFYIGAGTSGRLGIVDASECPPTFGVSHELVIGLIAGGDSAIRKAVEFAEDDEKQAWKDLTEYDISNKDIVIGIAASGRTPYVWGGLKSCQDNNITTGCIVCNNNSKVAEYSDFPIEVIVGAEFVTGSTRMKAGTAQKLVLNMLTTSVMVKLGKVKGNKMVDMQLSNKKLVDRGVKMIIEETGLSYEKAEKLLSKYGSVRQALNSIK